MSAIHKMPLWQDAEAAADNNLQHSLEDILSKLNEKHRNEFYSMIEGYDDAIYRMIIVGRYFLQNFNIIEKKEKKEYCNACISLLSVPDIDNKPKYIVNGTEINNACGFANLFYNSINKKYTSSSTAFDDFKNLYDQLCLLGNNLAFKKRDLNEHISEERLSFLEESKKYLDDEAGLLNYIIRVPENLEEANILQAAYNAFKASFHLMLEIAKSDTNIDMLQMGSFNEKIKKFKECVKDYYQIRGIDLAEAQMQKDPTFEGLSPEEIVAKFL